MDVWSVQPRSCIPTLSSLSYQYPTQLNNSGEYCEVDIVRLMILTGCVKLGCSATYLLPITEKGIEIVILCVPLQI